MLSCIIIDDEIKSRQNLNILLTEFVGNIKVLSMCKNLDEAVSEIKQQKPDIVFLDIQLHGETGFDLFEKIPEINFEVIFTTAYSDFAIKAFKYSAIDYLLKPIDIQDLTNAIAKVEEKKESSGSIAQRLNLLVNNLESIKENKKVKVALPCMDGAIFVLISDILYCTASGNYTNVTLADGKNHVVSKTLKEYEDMLEQNDFYRIHNSSLINLKEVNKYVKGDGGYVVMSNGFELEVSKRKKIGFLSKIGLKD